MLVHLSSGAHKVKIQNTILHRRDNFLIDWDGSVRLVEFELLVSKNKKEFSRLANFLGFKGLTEHLMAPVKPGIIKFYSGGRVNGT